MAYIANTAFEARITNNSRENLSHVAGLYQAGSPAANADCSAGLLCVRNGRVPNEGFDNPSGTRVYNENTWFFNAAADSVPADEVIYASDTYHGQLLSGSARVLPISSARKPWVWAFPPVVTATSPASISITRASTASESAI